MIRLVKKKKNTCQRGREQFRATKIKEKVSGFTFLCFEQGRGRQIGSASVFIRCCCRARWLLTSNLFNTPQLKPVLRSSILPILHKPYLSIKWCLIIIWVLSFIEESEKKKLWPLVLFLKRKWGRPVFLISFLGSQTLSFYNEIFTIAQTGPIY